ncbi:MAG: extracellular solute-binding protein [Acidimicrobiia bacterium]
MHGSSHRTGWRLGALLLALGLVAAACGGGTTATTEADTAAPGSTEAATGTTEASDTTAAATGTTGTSDTTAAAASGEPVEIRWYCCLGTGEDPAQQPTEKKVVKDFNASHPNIHLTFEVVTYDAARDTLSTQIASGNGPDIVGPVGVGGAEAFHGQWLDLAPLIEETGYDVAQYDPGAVDFYNTGGEGQVGLPFATYPSMVWYKASLFEEAGLEPPPHAYGDPYVWPDGTEAEWNYDTVRELALLLTVDANGLDATQDGFDPENIVQYGFEPQRDDLRGLGAYFGAGSLAADDGTTVQIPDAWADGWKYFYDGMWADHTIMTGPVYETPEFNGGGYSFFSGRVAMSENFLWTTYGVADAGDDWDLAAIPSHEGTTTSPLNADTFRIHADTEHPAEAFEVLTYLLGDASDELLGIYGGMPARTADQDAFFEALAEQFPQEVDWQVAKDSVQYADNPNFEAFMPKYNQTLDALGTYNTRWVTEEGLDMDAEIEALRAELQALWDR